MFAKLLSLVSGSGISTALYGVIVSLFVALMFVGYLYQGALENLAQFKEKLQIEQANTQTLKQAITRQNNALKALEVKAVHKDTSAIEKIVIKDESCEAQLRAYKEIFKELGR